MNAICVPAGSTLTSKALRVAYGVLEKAQAQAGSDHANDPQIMILLTDGKSNGGEVVLRPIVESIKKNITGMLYEVKQAVLFLVCMLRHSGHLGGTFTKDFSLVSIVHSYNMAAGLLSFESPGNG
ncbi:hypothetical protein AC249_AIPGENE13108 [Exaiptasia diaphana]|nr:hypothetical protein AC249_AIPGENE13108 [Exaiptasia diaphana]